MRVILSFFAVLGGFVTLGFSQTKGENEEWLKIDFKQVNVVANIEVEKIEIEVEWGKPKMSGGYTIYRFTGKVIESFKGKFKKSEPIVFYSFIEGQPPTESLKRNYIRFLNNSKTENGQKKLLELENSGAAIDTRNVLFLRKLR